MHLAVLVASILQVWHLGLFPHVLPRLVLRAEGANGCEVAVCDHTTGLQNATSLFEELELMNMLLLLVEWECVKQDAIHAVIRDLLHNISPQPKHR